MIESDELRFLHECGSQLRARLLQVQATSERTDDLRRVARSTLLDLLGAKQELGTPVLGIIDKLIPLSTGGSTEATLAAIQQQLHRTYNGQSTQQALMFTCGFLGLNAATAMNRVQAAPWSPAHFDSVTSVETPAEGLASSVSTRGLVAFNQSLILLVALGSLGVMGYLAIRNSSKPVTDPPIRQLTSAQPSAKTSPAKTAVAPSPPVAATEPHGDALYDAGLAVGGQRILLDLTSLYPTAEPGQIRFRYQLGNQSVDAVADCNRQSWTTYPEAESHSPQSAATARMMARVCDGSISGAPVRATVGAGVVFDPPSNIRATPNGAILCSITSRGTIPIYGREGDWYRTDFCGTPGFIHRGQLRF